MMNNVALTVVLLALLLVMPLMAIWALNTLFSLSIAYTFWTWLAAAILMGLITGSDLKKNK